ncbi:dihydropyrimidinase [Clostridium sp. MD294]|uniref:dihydropyrimidinase n=1 Tax=Clostridium sp. MD294 TaxID=97138 RepID=UPI0002CC97F8|nr:dihydropyrimidinase [Clostridium sp. MD294]NDO45399.1 dihydropyrimidinase [Clostridium sp. MD294]USF30956.1 D-hydantoinase [Clostridium sp. MD294]
MSKFDMIIKNGMIVTASDRYKGDIGIIDSKIAEIAVNLHDDADKVIDAANKFVFPGGIDGHTHLDMPFGGTFSSDDFITGTKAAACGGTTTIVDYSVQPQGKSLSEAAKIWHEKADNKACIDYAFHIAITDVNENTIKEMPIMVEKGYSSFKVYMVYDGMRVEDGEFIEILENAAKCGATIGVHCENYYVIKYLTEKLLTEGKIEPKYHPISRPAACEGEAANRAIRLAEMADAPLFIVHNSCEESISEIKSARERGVKVMGETCPQYLIRSIDDYEEPNFAGSKYVMSPPLRDKKNWDYIWKSIKEGVLQTVATDHCPFFMEQKKLGIDDFTKIPNGAPGIELRMPIMLSHGPKHGLTYEKIVEVTATNPAKVFGMYPQKGTIAVGSDADLFLYDPNKKVTVNVDMLHENVDYTTFDGEQLDGYPVMTICRGKVIAENGEFVGEEGYGKFVKRGKGQIL